MGESTGGAVDRRQAPAEPFMLQISSGIVCDRPLWVRINMSEEVLPPAHASRTSNEVKPQCLDQRGQCAHE